MINAQTQGSELSNISSAVIREQSTAENKKVQVFYSHITYISQDSTRQRQPFASRTDKFFNAMLSNFRIHHNTKSPLILRLQNI